MKILSLGAGVQSSTIFLMSCYGELDKLDSAVFADTGWEPAKVYEWLRFLRSEGRRYGIEIHVVSQGNIRNDALHSQVRGTKGKGTRWASMPYYTSDRITGKPGMIRRQCTYEYKIRPIEKKMRALAGYRPHQRIPTGTVEVWKGISTDEMQRSTISTTKWITFHYPLIEQRMSRHDCLQWFKDNKLPSPPRSSCLGCPYHNNREWRLIRDESPDEWDDVVKFDKTIRRCGGMKGDMFLHQNRVSLDEVDLRTAEDFGQLRLFDDNFRVECAGVCGV